jgi:hypothetical protein
MAVGVKLGTILSLVPRAMMVATDCDCGAILGVRSVAWTTIPGARAVIDGTIARVSGSGTMVPWAGVSLAATQNLGLVCCWGYARQ